MLPRKIFVVMVGVLLACCVGVQAVTIDTVPVGNPGNAGELSGGYVHPTRICGAVDYTYNIGKYEVTAGQYTEFLNKVAGVDTYGLYNTSMWNGPYACKIERFAGSGTTQDPYQYRVAGNYANRPVNYVSWGDSARFTNWLTNGQPTGAQGLTTTEDGAYFLDGATSDAALLAVTVPDATQRAQWAQGSTLYYLLPSEDEWYKAAYHKNDGVTGNYFDYPTSSDSINNSMANYDGSVGHTTDVGTYGSYPSPYGTFDQGGNVWEWTETVLDIRPDGTYRVLHGGPFDQGSGVPDGIYLHAATRWGGNQSGENQGFYVGIRIVEVPEPATIVMLALAGVGILRRRRA